LRDRKREPHFVTVATLSSTVERYLRRFGVQPHRSRSFKLSTDPRFVAKVGLY